MWTPNEGAAVQQTRALTATCWLLILCNFFGLLITLNGLRVTKLPLAFVPPKDDIFMLALLAGGIAGAVMLGGRKWGRWLFVASAIAIFSVAIMPFQFTSPAALFWLALCAVLTSILFSRPLNVYFSHPGNRPKLRTVIGVLFFVLACGFISLAEMSGFTPTPQRLGGLFKIILLGMLLTPAAIFLFISIVLEKIRSAAHHIGLALIGGTCCTAFCALGVVATAMTPDMAAFSAQLWSKLLNSNMTLTVQLSAAAACLGAGLVFISRRHESKHSALLLLSGLGLMSLLLLGAVCFVKPVWIECFSTDPDTTIQACGRIIQAGHASPQNLGVAYRQRGWAYAQLRQMDAAISDETMAISLRQNDAVAYTLRGYSYAHTGSWQDAAADYGKAIVINPRNYRIFFEQGIAYDHLSQWDKAIDDYNHAAILKPMDSHIYVDRGFAYSSIGKWKQSIADATKGIALAPNDDIAWNNRCYDLANSGDLRDALSDCNVAIKLGPHYDYSYDSRGFVYLQMKQYNASMSDYTLALMADSNSADALYGRALAEQAAGYDATADFAKAKSINPNIASQFDPFLNKAN